MSELFINTLKNMSHRSPKVDELIEQAEIFEMDIDFETLALIEPVKPKIKAKWLEAWEEKRRNSDINDRFDYDEPESRK